jgi:hypothetical protein
MPYIANRTFLRDRKVIRQGEELPKGTSSTIIRELEQNKLIREVKTANPTETKANVKPEVSEDGAQPAPAKPKRRGRKPKTAQ